MKRSIILFLTVVLTHILSAQSDQAKQKGAWIDLQIAQQIGLNSWSSAGYVNNGLPKTSITELRGVLNILIAKKYLGLFADMGGGVMPTPKMQSLNLEQMPMPHNGTKYYLREILSESNNNSSASAHFKMTFGFFGNIQANENLSIMPYLGIGFLTMPQRKYEIILKEHGSNMQYRTSYIWNYQNDNEEYDTPPPSLGYLTGRLNFKYKFSQKLNLMVGLEYTWFLDTLDFYGKYSNSFNANIERNFIIRGNKMNMIGISAGISFM